MKIVLAQEKELKFILHNFFKTWVPAHAITIYSTQGATLTWDFAIAEYDWLPWRERYTAISRAQYASQLSKFVM